MILRVLTTITNMNSSRSGVPELAVGAGVKPVARRPVGSSGVEISGVGLGGYELGPEPGVIRLGLTEPRLHADRVHQDLNQGRCLRYRGPGTF